MCLCRTLSLLFLFTVSVASTHLTSTHLHSPTLSSPPTQSHHAVRNVDGVSGNANRLSLKEVAKEAAEEDKLHYTIAKSKGEQCKQQTGSSGESWVNWERARVKIKVDFFLFCFWFEWVSEFTFVAVVVAVIILIASMWAILLYSSFLFSLFFIYWPFINIFLFCLCFCLSPLRCLLLLRMLSWSLFCLIFSNYLLVTLFIAFHFLHCS